MIDPDKYETLSSLVREAKAEDKKAFDAMEQAKLDWKKANERLTERNKVLKDWLDSVVHQDTVVE